MRQLFGITYETVTPESAEHGEADSSGVYMDNMLFAEAMSYLRNLGAIGCYCEADSYPVSTSCPPRWFTFYEVDQDYTTGAVTSYSLHVPHNVTPSSRMRIARALGCHGLTSRKFIEGV